MKNIIKNTIHFLGEHMMFILLSPFVMNIILIKAYLTFGWENFAVINTVIVLNMLAVVIFVVVVTENIVTIVRDTMHADDECDQ